VIDAGTQDVSKIEIIFHAGTRYQNQAISARAAISLLCEGTSTKTPSKSQSYSISTAVFQSIRSNRDFATLTLYSTNKYLNHLSVFWPI
jgi:hypothetical protein